MKKRTLLFLAALVWLCLRPCSGALGEGAASGALTAPDTISSFAAHPVTVAVPRGGFLCVKVVQMGDETVLWAGQTEAGTVSFDWDGLLTYGELPREGQETWLRAELTDETGTSVIGQKSVIIGKPECRIQFVLPSRDTIYAPDPLFQVDVKLSAPGTVNWALYAADQPEKSILTGSRAIKNASTVEVVRWRGTLRNGSSAPAGEYEFRFWPGNRTDLMESFTVQVSDQRAAAIPLEVTQNWADSVPLTREELARYFSSPVPAIDGLEGSGTPVYEAPSVNSRKLGSVHGSTVSVKILELGIPNGWTKVAFYRYGDGTYQEGYIRTDKLTMVRPSGHYGMIADIAGQMMHVFYDGEMIGKLPFSSSLSGLKVETCCGVFLTGLKMGSFREEGFQYDYATRIDGSNLIHQIGYRYGVSASFYEQRQLLGTPASHGCIRLAAHPGESGKGLTAWWIYSHIPKRTVLMVVDDYARRLGEAVARNGITLSEPVQDTGD